MEPMRTKIYGDELRAQFELPVALLIVPMGEAMVQHVSTQCQHDGLRPVVWEDLKSPPPVGAKAPLILIAELPPGERRIPEHVVTLMNNTFSDVPLLLLCSDALHRPAISLQGGRVTLVGPPPTPSRLSSRLRALLAGKFPSKRRVLVGVDHVSARWWQGSFGGKQSGALVRQHVAEGVTALLPLGSAGVSEDDVRGVISHLRRPNASTDDVGRAVAGVLGTRAALVHLSAAADMWSVYWPEAAGRLEIFSTQRFPMQWNLSGALARSQVKWARMAATGGDLVTVSSRDFDAASTGKTTFAEACADGGPAVVDYLDRQFAQAPELPFGAVVEVR